MGSITSWIRLEPRNRDDEMTQGVHARIYDPLWMLARQWQAAEFQGEDTGSPMLARWRGDSAPITRYYAGAIKPNTNISAPRYDAKSMPLEALVERQPLRRPTNEGSLRLAVESGMHFLRMLDAQPMSTSYRAEVLKLYALLPPTDAERAGADAETLSYWKLMATRALDGRRVGAAFRNAAGKRIPIPASLPIAAGDKAEVDEVINACLAQHDTLFALPQSDAPDAWNSVRMEYAFSIGGAHDRYARLIGCRSEIDLRVVVDTVPIQMTLRILRRGQRYFLTAGRAADRECILHALRIQRIRCI